MHQIGGGLSILFNELLKCKCGDSVILAIDTWSHDQACGHVTGCQSGSDKVLLVSVESPFDLAAAPGVVYSPSHTG